MKKVIGVIIFINTVLSIIFTVKINTLSDNMNDEEFIYYEKMRIGTLFSTKHDSINILCSMVMVINQQFFKSSIFHQGLNYYYGMTGETVDLKEIEKVDSCPSYRNKVEVSRLDDNNKDAHNALLTKYHYKSEQDTVLRNLTFLQISNAILSILLLFI